MEVSPLPGLRPPGGFVTSITIVAINPGPVVFVGWRRAPPPPRTSETPNRETTMTRVRIAAVLFIASSFDRGFAAVSSVRLGAVTSSDHSSDHELRLVDGAAR